MAGAWRNDVGPPPLTAAEIEQVAVPIVRDGGGALLWRRLRGSSLAEAPFALRLKEAYYAQLIRHDVATRELSRLVAACDRAGAAVVITKGWASARLYPEPGMRPSGDIDLFALDRSL